MDLLLESKRDNNNRDRIQSQVPNSNLPMNSNLPLGSRALAPQNTFDQTQNSDSTTFRKNREKIKNYNFERSAAD